MKILLLNPPYPIAELPIPPFGLMSLAGYLLENGLDVRIEDYVVTSYSKEHIRSTLRGYDPDVVGASGVTMNVNTALRLLKDYKHENPEIITVMGGPHVTYDAENILAKNKQVDFIVRGEGELTTLDLLECLSARSSLENVKGISYRKNGVVCHNKERPLIEDINALPFQALKLAPLGRYRTLTHCISMTTSRGCPYSCIFCIGGKMMGKKVRYFEVERVVDEFEMLSTMGFNQINIVDDLFTSSKKRCIAICDEIIKRGISHSWSAFARVNTVSRELLEKMKQAGCVMLCFGIETGNQVILDSIKKKTTIEDACRAIELCNAVGIGAMGSYILGLPGESHETIIETFRFAMGLNHLCGFHILAPFPGTEVREKKEEYGIRILTDNWDKYDANQSVSETPYISGKEIDRILNEFVSRPEQYLASFEGK